MNMNRLVMCFEFPLKWLFRFSGKTERDSCSIKRNFSPKFKLYSWIHEILKSVRAGDVRAINGMTHLFLIYSSKIVVMMTSANSLDTEAFQPKLLEKLCIQVERLKSFLSSSSNFCFGCFSTPGWNFFSTLRCHFHFIDCATLPSCTTQHTIQSKSEVGIWAHKIISVLMD